MRKAILVFPVVLFLLVFFPVHAGAFNEWMVVPHADMEKVFADRTGSDAVLQAKFYRALVPLAVDWRQTLQADDWGLREMNPILGSHPSDRAVNRWFSGVVFATGYFSQRLPEPLASSFLDSLRWTEELITEQNQCVFSGRCRDVRTIPFGIVFTVRF